MALVTKEFKLDLAPGKLRPVVNASQGDIGRPFMARCYWDGSPWTATGHTAKLRGKKPDNTVFEYTATVSGSSVTFSTTEQMTIISGPVECELVFSNDGDVIASANFVLIVEESPYNPEAPSESVIPGIEDIVTDVVDDVIGDNVGDWLDEHPEATTTVQDGAITKAKINTAFLPEIENAYVTPEMFGAVGDGVTDDTAAFKNLLDHLYNNVSTANPALVLIPPKKYKITEPLQFTKSTIYAYGSILEFDCSNETLITFRQKGASCTYECVLCGLTIETTERGTLTNTCVDLLNTSQFILRDFSVFHCSKAFRLNTSSIITFERPTIEYCVTCLEIETQNNNIYIDYANIFENTNVFNFTGGYVSDFYVSNTYLEENDVDILVNAPTVPCGLNNILFKNINIVKANLTSNTNDTYVIKTIAPASGSVDIRFVFEDVRTTFSPGLRQHHFADNDAKSNANYYITIISERLHVYYTSQPANTETIFKTANSSYYQTVLISNGTRYNESYITESSGYLRSGIDNTKWNNTVRQQLTFLSAPIDEQKKSLFYNQYTDRLQFKNNAGTRKDIVAGNKGTFAAVPSSASLADVITRFNDLLTVLAGFDILVKN